MQVARKESTKRTVDPIGQKQYRFPMYSVRNPAVRCTVDSFMGKQDRFLIYFVRNPTADYTVESFRPGVHNSWLQAHLSSDDIKVAQK